ncbi:choline transport protein [Aspergillus sclerotialis]|uniref:Choline transport protein n=1 Tax=Aspergillus sclerotialis TaxID=2070753 RepID=A0A3A2ZIW7_9EURO|nr:choline transport protein [Aspergillus sclerotialis]
MSRTINNIAYLIPILTNVLVGRRTMHRGPFYIGNLAGMSVNIITVAWLVFAIVFFSFPYEMPVKASNMNYTCACVGGFLVIEIVWWAVAGSKYSRTMKKASEEDANAARTMMISTGDK